MEVPTISRSLKNGCDCEMNPVPLDGNPGRRDKGKDPLLHAKQEGGKHRGCVNCKSQKHNLVTVTRLNW